MEFGEALVTRTKSKKPINTRNKKSKSKKNKGIRAKILAYDNKDKLIDMPLKDTFWYEKYVKIWKAKVHDGTEHIVSEKSIKLPTDEKGNPIKKTITLYSNPYTNPTHEPWFEKKDRSMVPKDKQIKAVIERYWLPIRPNLIVYGELDDNNEFVINF